MAIIELSVVPLGTGTTSTSRYVAEAIKVLQEQKGITFETTAMGTIIEGDLERILGLVSKMHQAVFASGAQRLITTIKIDDRRDKPATMASKVESLKKKLA